MSSEPFAAARRRLRGPELSEVQERRLLAEENETTRWRVKVVIPLMIVLNLVHVGLAGFGMATTEDPPVLLYQWAQALLLIHLVTAIITLIPLTLAWMKRGGRWLGVLTAMIYQLHAAAVAGADQLNNGTVAPYLGYSIVNAVLLHMSPVQGLLLYGVSTVAFIASILGFEQDAMMRTSVLPAGPSVMVPGVCLIWFLWFNRRQSFFLRDTIATQGEELQALNEQLEHRVEEQLVSIRSRTEEVEVLNQQLQAQVVDRSEALAAALKRLQAVDPTSQGVLAGRYELGDLLGAGGMGTVYAAHDRVSQRQVAVKVLRTTRMSADQVARFLREAQAAATLSHVSVVRMLEIDITEDGTLYQVQEYIEGQDLERALQHAGTLPVEVVLGMAAVTASALAQAHAAGIVHRDIKPSNLMIVPKDPGVKLLDFGVAKMAMQTLTQTGAAIGTPAYMAPELWKSGAEATPGSDVYALALTMLHAVHGEILPPGGRVSADQLAVFPASIRPLLERAVSGPPEDRPSASELGAAIEGLGGAEHVVRDWAVDHPGAPIEVHEGATHLSFG